MGLPKRRTPSGDRAPSVNGELEVSAKKSLVPIVLGFLLLGTVMPASVAAVGPGAPSGVAIGANATATPGHLFAVTLSLPPSVAAFDGRVFVAGGAAEVIGVATNGVGTAFMPVEIRGGYAIGAYGLQPSGSSTPVEIVVNPLRAGRLQVRVALDTAADSSGNRVDLAGPDQLVTVGVAGDQRVLPAPAASAHPAPLRGAGVARGPLHAAGVNVQDLGVLRAAWQSARAQGAVCRPSNSPADGDANGDGCVDIADVQAIAAAGGQSGTSGSTLPAARTTAAPNLATTTTFAHTFTVTSTADTPDAAPGDGVCADSTGRCTLRAAMTEADYQIGTDRIAFNLPGTAPVKIQLSKGLPLVTSTSGGVVIDGYSQPGSSPNTATVGSNAVPGVMISGNGSAAKEVAFYLTSAGSTIRGLLINNIWRGIFMDGAGAHDNQVIGNWLGFNADGSTNFSSGFGIVLNVGANHNVIGTPALADRNVIGNYQKGIDSYGPGTDFNVIQDNVFCIGPSGFTTAACGTGVDHDFGPKNELLGGFGPNERNVFGPTHLQGIEYSHGWNPSLPPRQDNSLTYQINNNQALGNWVGFRGDGSYDPTYRSGLDFSSADNNQGINVYDGTNFNVVDGNYIASVYDGIQMEAPNATGNIARNNIIGVSPLGQPAPLTGWGAKLRWSTTYDYFVNNTIRNAAKGGLGLIDTLNDGVTPISPAFNIQMSRNIITDTSGMAIVELGGANGGVLPPVISSATTSTVTGTATAGATIEIYHATRPAGQSGLPDVYIGSTTAGSGGAWTFTMPSGSSTGSVITALQTRTDNSTSPLATNVALGAATQTAPAITSAASTTFTVGTAGTFSVTSTGSPTPALSESGALPSGVTFTDNGNGTATLAGTPAAGTAGTYPLTITAANGVSPDASQSFTLTVAAAQTAPAITSAASTTFTVGTAGTFSVTSTGSPTPALSESGALPSGVTFTDNGNGTATLAGTPAAGTAGTYPLTITAANGVSPDASQSFTLTVSSSSGPVTIASDLFGRTLTGSWGSANTGGAWSLLTGASDYNVNGSVGTISDPAGNTRGAWLGSATGTSVTVSVEIAINKLAAGGSPFAYIVARRIDGTDEYRAKLRFGTNGAVYIQPTRVVGGTETALTASELQVAGLTPAAGSFIWLKATFSGTSPTAISMKAWADGTTEPSSWQVTTTDSASVLQASGAVGVKTYLSGAATNSPVTFSFDNLTATTP